MPATKKEGHKIQISNRYFIFEPAIFNELEENSVLEEEPLHNLAEKGEIAAFKHRGFWQPMDTYREAIMLNELWDTGTAPWKVWN